MAAIIEAENLTKIYRVGKLNVPALRGVSFAVERGEFVSIVGPSGSGKSTLFYLLGGLTRPSSGRVIIDGEDFSRMNDSQRTAARKRKIGFVFQKFNLLPALDAKANIDVAADIAGTNGRTDRGLYERIVSMLGIAERMHHRPAELSGGEQQRVALARALAPDPELVLLDEPFSSLDAALRADTREAVTAALAHAGATALLVTHDQAEALSTGRQVAVLRDGRLAQVATP
ncbi:MAG: ABC transporter ATP-binding protein, partial [Terriglobales bacterium]